MVLWKQGEDCILSMFLLQLLQMSVHTLAPIPEHQQEAYCLEQNVEYSYIPMSHKSSYNI